VAIGVASTVTESFVNRVALRQAFANVLIFAFLGLVGGVVFDTLRGWLGLEHRDTAYALLVVPTYVALAVLNLGLVTVLVWAHAGLTAAAALLVVMVITIPLVRSVGHALMRSDDLAALRHVSDERAAEVARLSTDRVRLLSEVLDAEQRERARLAESLHDGPMQRLVALRQDAAEANDAMARRLDAAISETRAIISSFHPSTVRELGFETSLRAGQRRQARAADRDQGRGRARGRWARPRRRRRWCGHRRGAAPPRSAGRASRARDGPPARRGRRRRARDRDATGRRDPFPRRPPCAAQLTGRTARPGNANGPGLNLRSHSLDACSITSWTKSA
jgi:hypothetical protein